MHRTISAVLAVLAVLALTLTAAPASASSPPVTDPVTVAHFRYDLGQTPENIALEPDGSADLTFAAAA